MPEPEPGGLVMRDRGGAHLRHRREDAAPRSSRHDSRACRPCSATSSRAPSPRWAPDARGWREGDRRRGRELGALRALPRSAWPGGRISARTCSSSTAPTASTSRCPRAWSREPRCRSVRRCPRPARPSPSRWPARCSAIERGRVEPGMTVAIFGHGPLGCLLALVAAPAQGARDHGGQGGLAARPGAARLALGRAGRRAGGRRGAPRCARSRAGGAPDVTVDATGRPEVWEQAVDAVGARGHRGILRGLRPGHLGAGGHTPCPLRGARPASGPFTTRPSSSDGRWRCWNPRRSSPTRWCPTAWASPHVPRRARAHGQRPGPESLDRSCI